MAFPSWLMDLGRAYNYKLDNDKARSAIELEKQYKLAQMQDMLDKKEDRKIERDYKYKPIYTTIETPTLVSPDKKNATNPSNAIMAALGAGGGSLAGLDNGADALANSFIPGPQSVKMQPRKISAPLAEIEKIVAKTPTPETLQEKAEKQWSDQGEDLVKREDRAQARIDRLDTAEEKKRQFNQTRQDRLDRQKESDALRRELARGQKSTTDMIASMLGKSQAKSEVESGRALANFLFGTPDTSTEKIDNEIAILKSARDDAETRMRSAQSTDEYDAANIEFDSAGRNLRKKMAEKSAMLANVARTDKNPAGRLDDNSAVGIGRLMTGDPETVSNAVASLVSMGLPRERYDVVKSYIRRNKSLSPEAKRKIEEALLK